jgi:hypothetical protein
MIFIFLLIYSYVFLPDTFQENPVFAFVITSTLDIRSAPNDTSRLIYTLNKYDKVQLLENTYQTITMTDGYDFWYKIRVDSLVGFTHRSYISGPIIQLNSVDTFDIVLDGYSNFNYNPDLNWYGIFSTNKGDELKKIELNPFLVGDEPEKSSISPIEKNNDNYVFAIGTKNNLKPSIIGVKSFHSPNTWLKPLNNIDLILYDSINGFSDGHKLIPEGRILRSKVAPVDSLASYTLYYSNNIIGEKIILYNPILNYFNQIPELFWYGDIDHDQLPEFLFMVNGDNRGYDFEFIKVYKVDGKLVMKKLFSKRPELKSSC